jgi:hypothetical protein
MAEIINIIDIDSLGWLIAYGIAVILPVFIFLLGSFKSKNFSKTMLLQEIRSKNIVFEILSLLSIYFFTFLRSYSTNSGNVDFIIPNNYSKDRLVGSFYLTLLYCHFIFCTLILVIFECYHENQITSKHINYHMNHGLKIFDFICYTFGRIHFKCMVHSIATLFFILVLEDAYCE